MAMALPQSQPDDLAGALKGENLLAPVGIAGNEAHQTGAKHEERVSRLALPVQAVTGRNEQIPPA